MNLGDGLLFELENGKPRLILLSQGAVRNSAKQLSFRPRASNVLSSRQPFCVEELQEEHPVRQHTGRHREIRSKAEGAVTCFMSNTATTGWRSTALTSSKTHEQNKGASVKTGAKVKSERQKYSTVGSQRNNGKTEQAQIRGSRGSGKAELKDRLASGETEPKDSVVRLTSEQLQQILTVVQASSNDWHPAEDHRAHASGSDDLKSGSSMNEGGGGEKIQENRTGGEEMKHGAVTDTVGSLQNKDNRSSGGLFSWMDERQSDSRAAKKAQWRRELDEQVALKQQQSSAPARLQAGEDSQCVLSGQSSVSHREQPAAIRSSLKLGEVTPMEEVLSVERREEQRRRWLEELDRQREETAERRKQEKLLQTQTEDHDLWATHFDSLQRRLPVQTALSAPPAAPSADSERGEREPSSSLSLVWEAASSCGAESVPGASVDTTSGNQTRASYLRTMTALLDPAQIEERERRRLKQLEQQRAIEAQVEERRKQREQEEARRREEEEEEERRVVMEREMLQRQYELHSMKERQKISQPLLSPSNKLCAQQDFDVRMEQLNHQAEPPKKSHDEERLQETVEPSITRHDECLEEVVSSSVSPYKDSVVQTEAAPSVPLGAERVQTPDASAQYQPPPSLCAAPPNSKNRAGRTGKENVCLPGRRGGADPYEAFARTERSRREKRRPEWNTHRPSCPFVPASERYPAALQRTRQESRLRRQAELLALQERTCLPRTDPPPTQNQEPRLCSNPTQTKISPSRKVESVSRGQSISAAISTERGRSPPVPAVRVQGQQASTPPLPVLKFIPYIRTDEVFQLDPLEPTGTPPPHPHPAPQSSAPPSHRDPLLHPELVHNTRTHRQEEILRGLAQLRQGLLQKQRELETDLNPLLKHRM